VRIDDDLKGHLQGLARQEGKSTSDVVRSLVQRYVRDRDRGAALRALWDRMQQNAKGGPPGPGTPGTWKKRFERFVKVALKRVGAIRRRSAP
jgi:hypothetical protein